MKIEFSGSINEIKTEMEGFLATLGGDAEDTDADTAEKPKRGRGRKKKDEPVADAETVEDEKPAEPPKKPAVTPEDVKNALKKIVELGDPAKMLPAREVLVNAGAVNEDGKPLVTLVPEDKLESVLAEFEKILSAASDKSLFGDLG